MRMLVSHPSEAAEHALKPTHMHNHNTRPQRCWASLHPAALMHSQGIGGQSATGGACRPCAIRTLGSLLKLRPLLTRPESAEVPPGWRLLHIHRMRLLV